nr:hypothetical protein StreXyl84_64110 [Streptomyces sp. Xyl84]
MKARESKVGFGFAPHRSQHSATRTPCAIGCDVKECALSGTGVTREDQHVAVGAIGADPPDYFCGLGFPADQCQTGIPRRALVPTSLSIVFHGCSRELRYPRY